MSHEALTLGATYATPFCEALGEPDAGRMYVDKAARMPEGWSRAFVGIFRGRSGSPLRICGYMSDEGQQRGDPPRWFRVMYRYYHPGHLLVLGSIARAIS